jgi:hypothetical protein
MLTSKSGVAGDTIDESGEDRADTNTGTSETDDGGAGTVDLGGSHDGHGGGLDDNASRLHGTAHHVGGQVVADGAIEQQAVAGDGLACRADDGAGDASWSLNE